MNYLKKWEYIKRKKLYKNWKMLTEKSIQRKKSQKKEGFQGTLANIHTSRAKFYITKLQQLCQMNKSELIAAVAAKTGETKKNA